jgi:ankyrin repeat protein
MALFDLLASNRTTEQKLIDAVSSNDVELLKTLFEDGVDLNKKVYKFGGDTALHLAATQGKTLAIQYLIDAGMNFEQPNDSGRTPLSNAVRSSQISAVKLLLMHCKSDPCLEYLWIYNHEGEIFIPENVNLRAIEIISAPNLLFQKCPLLKSSYWDQFFKKNCNEIHLNHKNIKLLFMTGFKYPDPVFIEYEKKVVNRIENIENDGIWSFLQDDVKEELKQKLNEILEMLQNMKKTPLPLTNLCRLTVRWSFWNKCNVYYGTQQLPLPTSLKKFIVFDGDY